MTGPEHYREAERLLALGANQSADEVDVTFSAAAQVHATLAEAAATALNDHGGDGMPVADWRAWLDVAGTRPEAAP